jgi:hypothetical protein
MKQCKKCKKSKELHEFYKSKTNKYGVMNLCKICDNFKRDTWRDANRNTVNVTNQIYKKNNPDKVKKWEKNYYNNNIEKIKIKAKIQRKVDSGKVNAKTAKRRAQKLHATPKWLTAEHLLEIQKFYIKAAELTKSTGIPHEVDHIVPLQGENVSGLHTPWNLQVLTKSENRAKCNNMT